jgi:hypothetical protein
MDIAIMLRRFGADTLHAGHRIRRLTDPVLIVAP